MNDTKRVWKCVKQIIHCKSKLDKIITKTIHKGNGISDSTAIDDISDDYSRI